MPTLLLAQVAQNDATEYTKKANAQVLKDLPFSDKQDFADAKKGLIEKLPGGIVKNEKGEVIWDLNQYDFLKKEEAPDTVNPSLWRLSQINMENGLFKVTDKVYQIRGLDLSNMTIIEGDTGLIIIDPLVSTEMAKAGLELYYKNRPHKPVKAVIYSHSHEDHFGGVKGVVTEADVKAGKVKIYAPDGFLAEAVSENIYAGNAMGRRSLYMYGALLPKGEKGQIDGGLGKTTSLGTASLIAPTDIIKASEDTVQSKTIDGIKIDFIMVPGTEAPSEMAMYFPQFKMLNSAEDITHTLHNYYTIRGAQVRDGDKWWRAIDTMMEKYGDKTDILIAQHHWPKWGNKEIVDMMKNQRDGYKYINDQALHLANKGYTSSEIGEMVKLPNAIGNRWDFRGYYGTVNQNAKAVYQRYLGWYSGNPADLYPLPQEEEAKRYVEFMGGADAVIKKAQESYNKGDYRWVASVMKQVVFADPKNQKAKNLEADALEQLGFQTENATWRNAFLMGAYELRNGVPKMPGVVLASPDTIGAMSNSMLMDYLSIKLNAEKAAGKVYKINWVQPDTGEKIAITVENSTVTYKIGEQISKPDVTLTLPRADFNKVLLGVSSLDQEIKAGHGKVTGDNKALTNFFASLDTFDTMFNVVTP